MNLSRFLRRGVLIDAGTGLFLFSLSLIAFYPGIMTYDSILQLHQAKLGLYANSHPPLMSFLWRSLNHFSFGPQSMLVFQNALFFSGLLFVVQPIKRPLMRVAAALAIVLWPAVSTQLGVIWKDVGLSASFLLGCGLLLQPSPPMGWRLAALTCFFYGLGIRHNAAPAFLPLGLWIMRPAAPIPVRTWLLKSAFVITAMMVFVSGIEKLFVRQDDHFGQVVWLHDLTAISIARGDVLIPEFALQKGKTLSELQRAYDPSNANPLKPVVALTREPAQLRALGNVWMRTVLANPGAYLKHRWRVFKPLMGIGHREVVYPFECRMWPNPWGFAYDPPRFVKAYFQFIFAIKDSLVFRAWMYLFACAAAVVTAFFHKQWPAGLLAASGLLYASSYFFYSVASDFRYVYWTVLASGVSWLWLGVAWYQRNLRPLESKKG